MPKSSKKYSPWRKLIKLASDYSKARTARDKMIALYGILEMLRDPLKLVLSVEVKLHDLALQIPEKDKEFLRILGYQFTEDLDNVPELFRNGRKHDDPTG